MTGGLGSLFTSGSCMILLCGFMVTYGFLRLVWFMYKLRKGGFNQVAFSRVMVDSLIDQKRY